MSGAMWNGYRLLQEDVWFFRDGRPSVLGSDHYLRSIFPPFPSTLYGLIRTQRLLEEGVDLARLSESAWSSLPEELRREIGEWGKLGTLDLRGPWFLLDDEILLPAPLDLRVLSERGEKPEDDRVTLVVRLHASDEPRTSRDWSHDFAPMTSYVLEDARWRRWETDKGKKDPESSAGWFVTLEGMRQWMSGEVPHCDQFVSGRRLWINESRTGVGLDSERRKHEEHRLYTFGFIRLQKRVSLGFELSGGQLLCGEFARFGGENRVARIENGPLLSDGLRTFAAPPAASGVLTLMTPAIFGGGALPAGHRVRSAVVPGPVLAGGWDLANRRPKPLHRAVPAGSVYWVDGEAPENLHSWSEKAKEGFGLMLAGHQPRRNHG
jgi:CRISPR-associated protein Cmr3